MFLKIVIGVVVVLALFLGYVSTRSGKFQFERSGVINAPAEKIFPYLSSFRLGEKWSPYDKPGMEMKKTFTGVDGEVGSAMEFESREAGSGKLIMNKIVPNELVEVALNMTAPIKGNNIVQYRLTPDGAGTRFTWMMTGEAGFLGKLMAVLIDCEKMIAGQFDEGISNLKRVVEEK